MTLSLVVGKEIQQAKKIPMNAPGRGDYRRKESLAHTLCRVAGPILSPSNRANFDWLFLGSNFAWLSFCTRGGPDLGYPAKFARLDDEVIGVKVF